MLLFDAWFPNSDQRIETMARDEKTSKAVASIASKAMRDPKSVTAAEIKKLAASALTQTADKPTAAKKAPAKKAAAKKPAAKKPAAKQAAAKKAPAKKARK